MGESPEAFETLLWRLEDLLRPPWSLLWRELNVETNEEKASRTFERGVLLLDELGAPPPLLAELALTFLLGVPLEYPPSPPGCGWAESAGCEGCLDSKPCDANCGVAFGDLTVGELATRWLAMVGERSPAAVPLLAPVVGPALDPPVTPLVFGFPPASPAWLCPNWLVGCAPI